MENKPTVNNGSGLFDNEGLCDTLLSDLNNLVKQLMNGQCIFACSVVTQMAQKIINLKNGIKTDMDALKEKVEDLKRMNDSLQKKDGAK